MKTSLWPLFLLLLFAALASVALAQPRRVFVSAQRGNDTGNATCSLQQPCRTVQQGHDNVAPGGEVVALDSGGFSLPELF